MNDEIPEIEPENILIVDHAIRIPHSEFQFTYSRSPGPGGQNVNKLNTKAHLHWDVADSEMLPEGVKRRFTTRYANRIKSTGELVIWSSRYRKQQKNANDCLEKLREMIESVARPPRRRKKTRPSRASNQRRLDNKRQRSQKKQQRQQKFE